MTTALTPSRPPAYSPLLKMPLWTSFTVSQPSYGGRRFPWRSDQRLAMSQRSSCYQYLHLLAQGYSQQPLFPPGWLNVTIVMVMTMVTVVVTN